ncbi:MAG: hypothetical protein L0K86_01245 [Actinomycetia bacterium]|nr:hypothetical protein [Actinomycetes bacterium]
MSPRVKYVLFQARYGWVMTVGLLFTVAMIDNRAWVVAAISGAITVAASVGTYRVADRPVLSAMPTNR